MIIFIISSRAYIFNNRQENRREQEYKRTGGHKATQPPLSLPLYFFKRLTTIKNYIWVASLKIGGGSLFAHRAFGTTYAAHSPELKVKASLKFISKLMR